MLPEQIQLYNYTTMPFAPAWNLSIPVKEDMLAPEDFYSDLARTASAKTSLNLLQGAYAVKKSRLRQTGKFWKLIPYFAAAWIGLLFLYPAVSYFILKQRVTQTETQIAAIYKREFPQASSLVAPKLRMEEKLHQVTSQLGEN